MAGTDAVADTRTIRTPTAEPSPTSAVSDRSETCNIRAGKRLHPGLQIAVKSGRLNHAQIGDVTPMKHHEIVFAIVRPGISTMFGRVVKLGGLA
jgi:hypothetical protein